MDKGQVSNYLGNYGVLSSYHEYFNDPTHWPTAAGTATQYSFGLGLIAGDKRECDHLGHRRTVR